MREARPQIAGRVDGVTSGAAQRHANSHDKEAPQLLPVAGGIEVPGDGVEVSPGWGAGVTWSSGPRTIPATASRVAM